MRRILLALFAVCCVLAAQAIAQKRAFSIEDLYRLRGVDEFHLSPDGKTIAFILRSDDLGKGSVFGTSG